jgi:lysyl-tRNA synthetase, class II
MNERLDDIIKFRKDKLERFLQAGIDPYPSSTGRTHSNAEVKAQFDELQGQTITLAGRIRSLRSMGKLTFVHIDDGTARVQILLKADEVGDEQFAWFADNYDIGDFIEATGTLFTTKTGEKTLQASGFKMLAKSLRPLPGEHYGIEDIELKLRKRYLDILMDPEAKELFVKKNKFWSSMREFLVQSNFLELEMPVLENTPGGAEAEPFITHHNALGRDFFLRISLELPLKKMLVAGYEKVFEIGRIFRNEGISTTHLQDYTQMEFYWAYGDFEKLMDFVQEMYQYVIKETMGKLTTTFRGREIDWSGSWKKVNYFTLFKDWTKIDLATATDDQLREYADTNKIQYENFAGRGRLIDLIFKKHRAKESEEKGKTEPFFLINQPIELEPLAKKVEGNPKLVQRMQIIAAGMELGKGFGELNDPNDQRERFSDQMKLREAGDKEAQSLDEDYLEAMEYGMPPAAGFGVSERLFTCLFDDYSVRETQIFPLMKEESSSTGKAKETLVAVAMVNKGANMEPWQELNTIAHLNAALGAREGKKLLMQDTIKTKDNQEINLNIQHAIMIKSADSTETVRSMLQKARQNGLEVAEFTREMIETTDDKKVIAKTKEKNYDEVEYLGGLIFGKKSEVEKLTKDLELYS